MNTTGPKNGATRTNSQDRRSHTAKQSRFAWKFLLIAILSIAVLVGLPRIWVQWELLHAQRDLSKGNLISAVERLRQLVRLAPGTAQAWYRLAVAERRTGHLDHVLTSLETAERLGWNKSDIARQRLLTVAQNGDVDSVDARLKAIMGRGASDEAAEEIYEALAVGFLKTYRLKEAWDCLNFWGDWQPKAIFPRIWRADICRRIMNSAAEEEEYRNLLAIDPKHVVSRARLAEVLKDSNRVEEAAREYETCRSMSSDQPGVLIGLAECQRRLGAVDKAVPLLTQAMKLNLSPAERSSALTQMGQIEADAGRSKEAVDLLETATELTPSEAPTLFALSQAYALAGNETKSQQTLELFQRVRAKRDRIEEIARALIDEPGNADLRYETGKILMDLGMKEDGAAWLRIALKMQPNHAAALEAISAYENSNSQK